MLQRQLSTEELEVQAQQLRANHWQTQASLDLVPVGNFSFYDQILDASFLFGNVPERVQGLSGSELDDYFRIARGRSANDTGCSCVHAG